MFPRPIKDFIILIMWAGNSTVFPKCFFFSLFLYHLLCKTYLTHVYSVDNYIANVSYFTKRAEMETGEMIACRESTFKIYNYYYLIHSEAIDTAPFLISEEFQLSNRLWDQKISDIKNFFLYQSYASFNF